MKTNQENNTPFTDVSEFEGDISNLYNLQTVRVLRQNGFYGVTLPVHMVVPGTSAATSTNYTTCFFIANRSYQILWVTERHETAGTDGSAVTVMLKKVPSGTAPSSGSDTLSAGISLKATANTNQKFTSLTSTHVVSTSNSRLVAGDALSLVTTGTLTSVAGVTVSVLLKAI